MLSTLICLSCQFSLSFPISFSFFLSSFLFSLFFLFLSFSFHPAENAKTRKGEKEKPAVQRWDRGKEREKGKRKGKRERKDKKERGRALSVSGESSLPTGFDNPHSLFRRSILSHSTRGKLKSCGLLLLAGVGLACWFSFQLACLPPPKQFLSFFLSD